MGGSPRRDAYELGKLPTKPSAVLREITTDPYFGTPLRAGDGPSEQFMRIPNVFAKCKAMPPRAAAALYRATTSFWRRKRTRTSDGSRVTPRS
ncbi:hypothetical protein SBRY_40926 [Actinacidiphila bryophytorum]|uniref:Uncharacterized protein n=1 Tax=Actinacidiphila bryophytorum TaxID=1436133 RepID=A0A9W4MIZ4_9ACTN|nr:hypothetical protein SBRY_40926 [Actinacidiphila bryophytorum]